MQDILKSVIVAAWQAGNKIMEVYQSDFTFESKSDNSPLTKADLLSNETIVTALATFGLPVLSEEGKLIPFDARSKWDRFWLIDPLDGTKEFIKRNREFTVNIALVNQGKPELGVVYVPVTGQMYYASQAHGSFTFTAGIDLAENLEQYLLASIKLPQPAAGKRPFTIVSSRTHSSPETESFINEKTAIHGKVELINAGSSLKLCLVAEGKANVYPRLAPTMEWDTAAGHAVVIFAGGKVYDYTTGKDLVYNKENLLNPWFVAEVAP